MLELAQLVGALTRGDVLADAAIAAKLPRVVEHRLAAHADPHLLAGLVEASEIEVAERAPRVEVRAVRSPRRLGHVEVVRVPAAPADHLLAAARLEPLR